MSNQPKAEKFSEERIQMIKLNLQQHADNQKPKLYEIYVDGLQVVSKTDDVSQFDNYELYINEETEKLKIILYQGASFRNVTFVFLMNNRTINPSQDLQGIPESVDEKIRQALRDKEFEDAKLQIENLKNELEEGKEYIGMLEEKLNSIETEKDAKSKFWDIAGTILLRGNEMVKRNPKLLAGIPIVGEALAGDIEKQQLQEEEYRLQQLQFAQNFSQQQVPNNITSFNEK